MPAPRLKCLVTPLSSSSSAELVHAAAQCWLVVGAPSGRVTPPSSHGARGPGINAFVKSLEESVKRHMVGAGPPGLHV